MKKKETTGRGTVGRKTALALLLASVCMARAATGENAFIVKDGEGRAEIVIAGDAVPVIRLAAEQLQSDVEAMTGATLPIVDEPTGKEWARIFVGRSPHTDALGIDASVLADGAYRMLSGEGWLALVGRDRRFLDQRRESAREMLLLARSRPNSEERNKLWERWYELTGEDWGLPFGQYWKMYNATLDVSQLDEHGSFNAVVDFLRMQGVRRYMRGELGVVMPAKASIVLPDINKTVRPDFPVRYAYEHGHRGDTMWQLWMGFNPAADIQGIAYNFHGTSEVTGREGNPLVDIPKPEEYYAMYGGRREIGGKQCFSSETLFEANVKYVRAVFDVFDEPMVSVMPSDSYQSLCQCEKCKGKSSPERELQGQLSNYVWDYVNRVAQEVYKTHPDRKIVCCAYGANRLPPTNIKQFSPNVVVSVVQGRRTFAYHPEEFDKVRAIRRGFLDLLPGAGPRLLLDESINTPLGVPSYQTRSIVMDLRALKGIALGDFVDIYSDRKHQGIKGIQHLNTYVLGRFWWDADQDLDALLNEYYEKFYGPARAEMKAFIEYSEAHWPGLVHHKENVDTVRGLLATAQARVEPDSVYGKRIALVADFIEELEYRPDRLGMKRENVPTQLVADAAGKPVVMDGRLDDPMWDAVPDEAAGWLEDTTGDEAPFPTRFMLAWDDNNLYLGVHCQDMPDQTVHNTATRQDDPSIWYGDVVELLLETQVHSYYQISISPAGALMDLSHEGRTLQYRWSSNAQIATHIGEDYWSVEARIPIAGKDQREVDPLDGVAGFKPTAAEPWYFNVCRQRVREDSRHTMSFSPTFGGFQKPDRFATLLYNDTSQPDN